MPIAIVRCESCMSPDTAEPKYVSKKKCEVCGTIGDFKVFKEIEIEQRKIVSQTGNIPYQYEEMEEASYDDYDFAIIGNIRVRLSHISAYTPDEDDARVIIMTGGGITSFPMPTGFHASDFASTLDKILKIDGKDK